MSEIIIRHTANRTLLLDYNTPVGPLETRHVSDEWLANEWFNYLIEIGELVLEDSPIPHSETLPDITTATEEHIVELRQECINAGVEFETDWDCERLKQELSDAGDA